MVDAPYRCPSCGTADPAAYVRCQRSGCPDGRDPRPDNRISDLEFRIAELRAERDDLATTIKRVWAALGNPSYESLNGLTISELVADTQQNYVDANEAHLDCIRVLEQIADARMPGEARRLAVEQLRSSRSTAAESRVSALSAEVERLKTALKPFATYLDIAKFDLDNMGNPLPDDQGVGWVYLTVGDFRRARASLNGGSDHG